MFQMTSPCCLKASKLFHEWLGLGTEAEESDVDEQVSVRFDELLGVDDVMRFFH